MSPGNAAHGNEVEHQKETSIIYTYNLLIGRIDDMVK